MIDQQLGGRVSERTIKITVESYEVLLIKRHAALGRSWCASCSKQVTLIGMNDACAAGLSAEAINRRGETGRLHVIEIAGEPPFICLNSLIQTERR